MLEILHKAIIYLKLFFKSLLKGKLQQQVLARVTKYHLIVQVALEEPKLLKLQALIKYFLMTVARIQRLGEDCCAFQTGSFVPIVSAVISMQ